MLDITSLFCSIDDFYKNFKLHWKRSQINYKSSRGPSRNLSMSEIMTILILFHQSNSRTFKYFYLDICKKYKKEFPKLPSYPRFVTLQKIAFIPLFAYLNQKKGKVTGLSFIDATAIKVCHIARAFSNKVFKGLAKKGKSSMGWFFGIKLHLIINDRKELLSIALTPSNV